MLWKPATSGEELFLSLHEKIGSTLDVASRTSIDLDALVSEEDFCEFVQLAATMEIFVRCVRSATSYLGAMNNPRAKELGMFVCQEIELPGQFRRNQEFSEILLQTGRVAFDKPRNSRIEKAAMGDLGMQCYMCGTPLTRNNGAGANKFTIEHLWPLSFGGETIEENLLPACANCNNRRKHMLSWAWGPVQSTYLYTDDPIPNDLRLSLGLARLLHFAKASKSRRTLKEVALQYQPLQVELSLTPGKHHLYFELMPQVRTS